MESQRSNKSTNSQCGTKTVTLQKLLNKIYESRGNPFRFRNLAKDMADGIQFVQLFNYLFNEKMELKLSTANSVDQRVTNWNKINGRICFNYLQQRFILIASTMHALAGGKTGAATKVVSYLIDSVQGSQFEDCLDDNELAQLGDILNWEETEETPKSKPTY